MSLKTFSFAIVLFLGFNASAKLINHSIVLASNSEKRLYVDAVEPTKVCDRFLNDIQKAKCISEMKRPFADSYLTSVCDRQFDDDAFFKCLGLAEQYHFDPRKIQPCGAGDLEDQARLNCLAANGQLWKPVKRDPEPATSRFPASNKLKRKGAKHPHVRATVKAHKTTKKSKKK